MYLFSLSIVVEKEGNVLPVLQFVRRDGPPWIPDHVVVCLHQSGVLVSKRRQTTANVVFRFCDQVEVPLDGTLNLLNRLQGLRSCERGRGS